MESWNWVQNLESTDYISFCAWEKHESIWFYGLSAIVGYLMPNTVYTYKWCTPVLLRTPTYGRA